MVTKEHSELFGLRILGITKDDYELLRPVRITKDHMARSTLGSVLVSGNTRGHSGTQ